MLFLTNSMLSWVDYEKSLKNLGSFLAEFYCIWVNPLSVNLVLQGCILLYLLPNPNTIYPNSTHTHHSQPLPALTYNPTNPHLPYS